MTSHKPIDRVCFHAHKHRLMISEYRDLKNVDDTASSTVALSSVVVIITSMFIQFELHRIDDNPDSMLYTLYSAHDDLSYL